jgi:hypothetical protein
VKKRNVLMMNDSSIKRRKEKRKIDLKDDDYL